MGLGKLFARFSKGAEKTGEGEKNNNSSREVVGTKGKLVQCRIILLDDTDVTLDVRNGCKGELLLEKVFSFLDLQEKSHFGVRFLDEANQTHWLEPSKQLSAQLKTPPPHALYFGVRFYPVDPCKMKEELTRYQFFLQVKSDILYGRIPVQFDFGTDLATYAIQSELGDYDPKIHSYGYVSEFRFIPNQTEEFELKVEEKHKKLRGIKPSAAEFRFLERVKWLEMYGVDLHPVKGDNNQDYFVGVTPIGIVIYRDSQKVGNYFWTRIVKITYKSKQFGLRVRDRNQSETILGFECKSKPSCKHLWKCCVDHHAFYRTTSETESYNNTGKFQLFSLGSKHRYSGRSLQDAEMEKQIDRHEPKVVRKPSKRHQRRDSAESLPTLYGDYDSESQQRNEMQLMGPRTEPQGRDRGYMSAPESPRSSRAPWDDRGHRKGGLFTSGRDSPNSAYSERLMFPRRQYESESEGGQKWQQQRGHGYEPGYNLDDFDETCRVPAEYTDASESEAEYHRRRRKHRRSAENVGVAHEQEWQRVQQRIRDPYAGYSLKPHGSVSSVGSGESASRRRRRRSRSPGNKRPPDELAQHFKYVDPAKNPEVEQQMKSDIPYTIVSTETIEPSLKAKAHRRHRSKSPRTKNMEVLEKAAAHQLNSQAPSVVSSECSVPASAAATLPPVPPPAPLPDGMLPPIQPSYHIPPTALNTHFQAPAEPAVLQAPVAVQRNISSRGHVVKTSHVARVHQAHTLSPTYQHPPPYLNSSYYYKQPTNGQHCREDSGVFIASTESSAQGSPGSGQHQVQNDHTYEPVDGFYSGRADPSYPPIPPLPVNYQAGSRPYQQYDHPGRSYRQYDQTSVAASHFQRPLSNRPYYSQPPLSTRTSERETQI